ncbi:MAG: Zn-dependent alcohol dehydrogenase [Solirubrobacterales bacterium]|nr:Zn-dependent alcohol dehydrogenase [Solirubrobacterales bacterium]
MKAIVFDGEAPAHLAEVELADPRAGEVRVRIAAAGVCHSDLHVRRGEWAVPLPLVMGHEGSGVITAVGDGVTSVVPGDHVILSWVPACGECRACRAGRPAQCFLVATVVAPQGVLHDGTSRLRLDGRPIHHYLGVSSFAEEAVIPESGAVPIRKDAPLDVAALIGCGVATGIGAVQNTAQVPAGASVAVLGCGGVGLSCIAGARLAGAESIVAVDVLPAKLGAAHAFGATDTVDASGGDAVERLRELQPEGVDFAFDAIGKTDTTEQAIAMLALGGAAVIVGLPPTGARASFEPLTLAEADQRILGSNYGSVVPHRDFPVIVDLYMDGTLPLDDLVSARRPLGDAEDALQRLARGEVLRTLLLPGE